MMYYSTNQWFFFFYIYCFLGWLWESLYVSAKQREWVNRGFMHGPFLPIYGSGAIAILLATIGVRDNLVLIYILGMVSSTVLEYFTGAAMEKIFGVRYWDYSEKRFNLNGHICLSVSLAWGVFSIILVKVIHPPLEELVLALPDAAVDVSSLVLTIAVAVDTTVSAGEALDLKETLKKLAESNEEIRKLQGRADFVLALAEDDLQRFKEEQEEKQQKFKERFESNLQAARRRSLARLDSMREQAEAHFAEMDAEAGLREEFFRKVEEQKEKIHQRTDREFRRSSRILRRNPGSVSRRYKEELQQILELFEK